MTATWRRLEAPSSEHAQRLLSQHHGAEVLDLEPLAGGFWSAAFGYRVGGQDLVARFGSTTEGFEADRRAEAHRSAELPVPRMLHIGRAEHWAFAVSERHHGQFLEQVPEQLGDAATRTQVALLVALASVVPDPAEAPLWPSWLLGAFVDEPSSHTSGWRASLAARPQLAALHQACESRVRELVDACPQRYDLVHGDLLHQNVLVSPAADRVTAVFSWKCSVRGDFLYDTAWCTFWSPWYGRPGDQVWSGLLTHPLAADPDRFVDAAARHHCYELQIGASHVGWYLWTRDEENLARLSQRLVHVLERGPLPLPG